MLRIIFSILILSGLFGVLALAAIPSTALYPFPGHDLEVVRTKTKAESSAETQELMDAWHLYREIQGCWMPASPKPPAPVIARLDQLKRKLEALQKPRWFSECLDSPQSGQSQLADKVGDQVFEKQRSTPEYQMLKALAVVYLTEHELDRAGSAQSAHRYLTTLSITHPWDWQLHGLLSRLLIDERLPGPAWEEAKQSIFLNPKPNLEDLKFFAFIGGIAAKGQWTEIQEAIKQAATDRVIAELAIVDSEPSFASSTKLNNVVPKTQ